MSTPAQPVAGGEFRVKAGGFPVRGVQEADASDEFSVEEIPTFGEAFAIGGEDTNSRGLAGLMILGDPGQEALRTAARTKTPVEVEWLYDGTNGWKQDMLVEARAHKAAAGEKTQDVTFSLRGVGAATIVGTGPLP